MKHALRSLFLAAAGWFAVCSAPLCAQQAPAPDPTDKNEAAQEPATEQGELPRAEDIEALRERYRPALHPGDPLVIVGNEQGGNDLRALTPLLARGQHTALQVDVGASYERALAMYGEDVLFHTPLPPATKVESAPRAPQRRQPAPEPAPQERGPQATPWSLLSGLLVSGLLLVWFFVRVRPALIAPKEETRPEPEAAPFVWRPTRRVASPLNLPREEPRAPLPQRTSGITGGARMARQPKRR